MLNVLNVDVINVVNVEHVTEALLAGRLEEPGARAGSRRVDSSG